MLISPVRNQMCLVKVMKKCGGGGGGIHNIVETCMHTLFFPSSGFGVKLKGLFGLYLCYEWLSNKETRALEEK